MARLALLIGLLCLLPLAAGAQEFNRSGGKLISPPSSPPAIVGPAPSDGLPVAPAAETSPKTSAESAGKPVPPAERSSVAVAIPPAVPLDVATLQASPTLEDRMIANRWIILLAAAVISLAIVLVAVIVAIVSMTRRRLRAYVFVSGAEIVDLDKGSVPVVKLEIKNAGQTPAYRLSHVWRCGTYSHPLDEKLPLPYKAEPMSWAHLGPGAAASVSRSADIPYANGVNGLNGAAGALPNHPVAFYVYGEIVYRDAFHQRHFTRYLLFQPGPPRLGRGPLLVHERGNEAN